MAEAYTGPTLAFSRESKFKPEPFATIAPHAQPWRIKGVLPARGVAFIVGQSKAGKSFLAIDAVLRLAAGAPKVWGRRASQCGVIYVAAEDPDGCRARVTAWRRETRRTTPTPFELIGQGLNLLDDGEVDDFIATVDGIGVRFADMDQALGTIVFDTLSRCIPGLDENSSTDMSRAFQALERIAAATGALILVVAHFGKAGSDKGIRGWSGMDANSDATITLERDSDDPNLRTLTFAKVKNGMDGGQLSFRLKSVDLGLVDEDGEPITSCVPEYEATPEGGAKPKKARALTPPEQVVFAAVKRVTDHGPTHSLPATVAGAKPWMKAVTRDDVRAAATASGLAGDDKPATVRQRFSRAVEGLSAAKKVRVEGELIWLLS